MRNEDWHAISGKEPGDTITLWLRGSGYSSDVPESLIEGTVSKVTRTTRKFTIEGAQREGEIQLRARMRWARETPGFAVIDGERVNFSIATPQVIARLTDPNRALRETLDEAMRDLLHWRDDSTKENVWRLISDLGAALKAATDLHAALPDEQTVDA